MNKKIYKIAHRGYSSLYPENTKLAFSKALDSGFDGVEIDLHLTKDNQIVIIHDNNTKRLTDKNLVVKNSNLEELKKLNLAAKYKEIGLFEQILTIEEFLELYVNKFDLINLEIKVTKQKICKFVKILLNKLSPYLNNINKFVFSSFNYDVLYELNKNDKNLKLAFLCKTKKALLNISKFNLKIITYLAPSLNSFRINKKFYDSYNKYYLFWTLKTKKSFLKYSKFLNTFGLILHKPFWYKKQRNNKK
ncbi:glycerophosphodiester phosphodiesterase family protein [Mycoplasmopsis alligatoris]|uniref:Glycerophosphodiester phosphodiesterase family protein n=1 Tax=Mycoplasmopsis alligatoris A21JP2 TaxID=747682 RepID=D4XVJ7_9BACT|nr:glycerophosphodiester phosphodiesterase family protein [Mycoplasmopsis alligatoris]EFF41583.1 glycerophosphodiester phosphodiesterase family protein [Mycoplasmopsis alligatoris A21JP2]